MDDGKRLLDVESVRTLQPFIRHLWGLVGQHNFGGAGSVLKFVIMLKSNTNNNASNKIIDGFFGGWWYFLLSLLIAIPVFIVVETYVNTLQIHEDEAVAFAGTVCFMLGIFAGRYIARIWLLQVQTFPKRMPQALSMLIVACVGWLFFHADFPLAGRTSINLMLFWLPFSAISIAMGVLIKVVREMGQQQLKTAQQQAAHSQSELHQLQSQLSPHFLFNTLNNLYGLSITNHEKIPPLLLKLSELLRYAVYEASALYVPLQEEIAYIRNYIEFEKIRIGDRLVLTTDIAQIMDNKVKIAPMLLIVFIENAFKHSKNTTSDEIFIDIQLKTWGNSILFSVKNSYENEIQEDNMLDKSSGVGLPNVTKRLEMLYHNAHELAIRQDEHYYEVALQLKMKSNE
jgi:sensor histidine kinase YesM